MKEIFDSNRGLTALQLGCPPEVLARVEQRNSVIVGLETRSAEPSGAAQAWREFTTQFPKPSSFRSFAGISTKPSRHRNELNDLFLS